MADTQYSRSAPIPGESSAIDRQRALEAEMLMGAARKMEKLSQCLKEGTEFHPSHLQVVLSENGKLWENFLKEMQKPDCLWPAEIRNNIATLAQFTFKQSLDILDAATAEKISVLVDINRAIAAGLQKQVAP